MACLDEGSIPSDSTNNKPTQMSGFLYNCRIIKIIIMKKFDFKEIMEITCRLYVFFFLTIYGIGKIIGGQFYTEARIPDEIALMPIGLLPDFELAWTFMGRSFGYILFIGLAEIIGASTTL